MSGVDGEHSIAEFSKDDVYRYTLERAWGPGERLVWVMLNPSTADASEDDPTIRRVRAFTKREGYDGFTVVNLFALRSTDPGQLLKVDDPVGPGNEQTVRAYVTDAPVVLAWGGYAGVLKVSDKSAAWISEAARECWSLGVTQFGFPRHPLYLASGTPLEAWRGPTEAAPGV